MTLDGRQNWGRALAVGVLLAVAGCTSPFGLWGLQSSADCSEACVAETHDCHSLDSVKQAALMSCHVPCKTCGRVINCCACDDAIGPPEIPPPGRFHPVPTRPVFSGTQQVTISQ